MNTASQLLQFLQLLRATPIALAAALAACGGGGDEPPAAADGSAGIAGSVAGAGGRAQALAATLPPLQPTAPATANGNVRCANQWLDAVGVDNVEVPAGTACRLLGTLLRGNLQIAPGAIVEARDLRVGGSVQADRAAHLLLEGAATRIGGSVQLQRGGGATITAVSVDGDIQLEGLDDVVRVRDSRVGGNLQLKDGRGGAEIRGNRMVGNLQCSGNVPAPLAEDNLAASIEDQCRPGAGGGGGGGGGGSGGGGTVPPLSGNVRCDGLTIGALSLDSVFVPAGARCTLLGTRLIGSIEVGIGAQLAADGVQVNGNLQAEGAEAVGVSGASRFGGSVQVKRGGTLALAGATVTGDVQVDDMAGSVAVADNRIGGNLQAMANRGGVALAGNRIQGNLQCKDNRPAPTGGGNLAAQKEDQCRGL